MPEISLFVDEPGESGTESVNLIFDNLEFLQRFDKVKVYYDDGQFIVTKSLHDAIEYALASNAVIFASGAALRSHRAQRFPGNRPIHPLHMLQRPKLDRGVVRPIERT